MIRFDNVHKTYKTGTNALKGVSFKIEDGEFVFIIGRSGSGKSTIVKLMTREEQPSDGRVFVDHFPISHMSRVLIPVLRRHVGMIFQDFRLIESKNVFENVAFAGEIVGMPRKELIRTVEIVLSVVGLRGKAAAMPHELSGGEQQRVAIARAMVNDPKLILADEPTGNLDPTNSEAIMALLEEINRNGTTVVICTHDSNLVDRMKKRVIEISDGVLVRDESNSGYSCFIEEQDSGFSLYSKEENFAGCDESIYAREDPEEDHDPDATENTQSAEEEKESELWINDQPQGIPSKLEDEE